MNFPDAPAGIGVRLDYCWVCNNPLLDAGGSAEFLRNEHHVIPRAYGGSKGPTVSLDSAHHDLLHLISDKMLSGQPWDHLVKGLSKEQAGRVLYLSTRVVDAAKYAEGDPNKRITMHVSLSRAENTAVQELANFHGLSKENLVKKLLGEELQRRFPGRGRRPG